MLDAINQRIFIRLKWFWYSFLENTFALKQALYKRVVVPPEQDDVREYIRDIKGFSD